MNKDLYQIKKELKSLVSKQENNKLRYYYNNAIYNSNFLFIDNVINSKKIKESPLKDIALNYLIKSEKIMPEGSYLLSKILIELANNKEIVFLKKRKNLKTIYKIINENIKEEKYNKLIKNIFNFSGPDSSIICKTTENSEIEVVKENKSYFNINIHPDFENVYFQNQSETTKKFKVVVMDAFIERESEIMTVVEKAHSQKMPIVLICRGISKNFCRNIKEILVKNKISLYPYIAKFNDADPFFLSDISTMLNAKIYSVESGDNFIKNLNEKSVEKTLRLTQKSIEFFDKENKLLSEIDKKISETDDVELKGYLIKRKKRLSTNKTIVYVPKKDIKLLNDIKSIIFLYNKSVVSDIVYFKNRHYSEYCFLRIKSLAKSFLNTTKKINYVIKLRENNV